MFKLKKSSMGKIDVAVRAKKRQICKQCKDPDKGLYDDWETRPHWKFDANTKYQ